MNQKYSISACIITLNEESRIRDCLESVKWVDEIIVVDSFSTDKTVDICRNIPIGCINVHGLEISIKKTTLLDWQNATGFFLSMPMKGCLRSLSGKFRRPSVIRVMS